MTRTIERPHLGWWVAVIGGLGVLACIAFHPGAYVLWSRYATAVIPAAVFRTVFVAAMLAHLGEAMYAARRARQVGLADAAMGWFVQTLMLGYPSLRLLLKKPQERAVLPEVRI